MGVSFYCYRVVTGVVIGENFSKFLKIRAKKKTAKTLDFKRFLAVLVVEISGIEPLTS